MPIKDWIESLHECDTCLGTEDRSFRAIPNFNLVVRRRVEHVHSFDLAFTTGDHCVADRLDARSILCPYRIKTVEDPFAIVMGDSWQINPRRVSWCLKKWIDGLASVERIHKFLLLEVTIPILLGRSMAWCHRIVSIIISWTFYVTCSRGLVFWHNAHSLKILLLL